MEIDYNLNPIDSELVYFHKSIHYSLIIIKF